MKPLFIHNIDCIQLLSQPEDVISYFPVSTHLRGKKIHTMYLNLYQNGYDLSGKYLLAPSLDAFISLYDAEGNLFIDKFPLIYFNPTFSSQVPIIDREIDWERSFIYWNRPTDPSYQKTFCFFFSVFINGEKFPVPSLKNRYTITIPVNSSLREFSFYNKMPALAGKKITAVYSSEKTDLVGGMNAYLYLVPETPSDRYINYIPIAFLENGNTRPLSPNSPNPFGFLQNIFLDPVCIDFNRSKLFFRMSLFPSTSINLTFCYEE